jgi:hypothetical protein
VTTLVDRASSMLESLLSRRSFITRSAFVGSAIAVGAGLDLALRPGTAYGAICACGNHGCDCSSTCCAGFSEFCCSVNGGLNMCPENTILGGWWKADNSPYCSGPRYYMDCNAVCSCDTGCGNGWQFCEPGCDGVTCTCGFNSCDQWVTGCFQFRYGQCNQDVTCLGRIVCRLVACVPPWQIDSSCTTTVAVDEGTATHDAPCWTPAPPASITEETVGKPVMLLSPKSQLPVIAARTPNDSLWLWWLEPDSQWQGPLGIGPPGSTLSDPVMDFGPTGFIILTAEGPSGLPYVYWQTSDSVFHGPLGLPG